MTKKIQEVLSQVNIGENYSENNFRQQKDKNKSLDDETMSIVNNLFLTMQQIFPAFKQAWPTQAIYEGAKKQWVKAFMDANLTDVTRINKGLSKFRQMKNPFVPSAGQFIAWCKPGFSDLGLPDYVEAYKLSLKINAMGSDYVCDHVLTDTLIRHAIGEIGHFAYREMKADDSKKKFVYFYERAIDKYQNGEIQPVQRVLKHDKSLKSVKVTEKGKNALRDIHNMLANNV